MGECLVPLTLSLPHAIIIEAFTNSVDPDETAHIDSFTALGDKIGFANSIDPDETAHNEPSYQDLRCLTISLSTLHINFFPDGSQKDPHPPRTYEDTIKFYSLETLS